MAFPVSPVSAGGLFPRLKVPLAGATNAVAAINFQPHLQADVSPPRRTGKTRARPRSSDKCFRNSAGRVCPAALNSLIRWRCRFWMILPEVLLSGESVRVVEKPSDAAAPLVSSRQCPGFVPIRQIGQALRRRSFVNFQKVRARAADKPENLQQGFASSNQAQPARREPLIAGALPEQFYCNIMAETVQRQAGRAGAGNGNVRLLQHPPIPCIPGFGFPSAWKNVGDFQH